MASFQGLVEVLDRLVLLASAFSLVQDNSSDQGAFPAFASFLVGPSEVALAFGVHLALLAWVLGAFSFSDHSFP